MAAGAKLADLHPARPHLSVDDRLCPAQARSRAARKPTASTPCSIATSGTLDRAGAGIVLTADHGMKDKHLANGEPDVIYLEEALDVKFGPGKAKVILPITDPYVAHHGALGSFATVYLFGAEAGAVAEYIRQIDGIDLVLANQEACARFELPADRTGDLVVISGGPRASKVIGIEARQARSVGADGALALAWRSHRTGNSHHHQPEDRRSRRGLAQLRCILHRLQSSGGDAEGGGIELAGTAVNKVDTEPRQFPESMRIGGRKVDGEEVIPVRYPYSGEVIGTVPAGRAEHARKAFAIAAGYRSEAVAL